MKHNSVSKTKKIPLVHRGAVPTQTRLRFLSLKVGESFEFDEANWPLKSSVSGYIATFKRIGRVYSLKHTPKGKAVVVRVQ